MNPTKRRRILKEPALSWCVHTFPYNMALPPRFIYSCLLLIECFAAIVTAFNLDIPGVMVFRSEENSDFGYSIALHKNLYTGNKVIVGAPRANTSVLLNQNITNGGAIYGCSIGEYGTVSFDRMVWVFDQTFLDLVFTCSFWSTFTSFRLTWDKWWYVLLDVLISHFDSFATRWECGIVESNICCTRFEFGTLLKVSKWSKC